MRNMSFAFTERQFLDGTKDVTRRVGWLTLKAGDLVCGVRKGMGLKKGEKIRKLGVIRIVDVRRERLDDMLLHASYGSKECVREGFPLMSPAQFCKMFIDSHDCALRDLVTRIVFEHYAL